jgi:hypothetical protein
LSCEEGVERFLHRDVSRLSDRAIWAEYTSMKAALARRLATRRDRWIVFGLDQIRENAWICERMAVLTAEARRRRGTLVAGSSVGVARTGCGTPRNQIGGLR